MPATLPATEKQMRYLRDLVAATDADLAAFLVDRGITKTEGWPTATIVARVPTKTEASRLIGDLAPGGSRPRRGGGRRYLPYRCTHIDYPCCGCGPDAGR